MCEEVVEKAGDTKAKANLQPPSYVWKINSRCPKGYRLFSKKDKEDTQREYYDETFKDREKAKFYTLSITNQSQTQNFKKCHGGQQRNCPATGINATEVVKKEKDKAKDLNHVNSYTCKQKDHYANKCPDKSKN